MPKRIESKTSRTAQMTCGARAVSYSESRDYYKSDDYISSILIPSFLKHLLKFPLARYLYFQGSPKGSYEYVVARTKYIDYEFAKALHEDYEQILIFGAGFDSRVIRFQDISKKNRIFEIDAPITQSSKLQRYKELGIINPDNLTYIPVNFDKENIIDRLNEKGFAKNKKSLFILEGLTMYLQPESAVKTFKIIQEFAGAGSMIVFDYIYASVLRKENLYYGEKEIYKFASGADEKWYFGIEKGRAGDFLAEYGFEILNHMDSNDLENKFFKDKQGNIAGRVNGTHCIVTAIKTE